jgi:hypothetical protein
MGEVERVALMDKRVKYTPDIHSRDYRKGALLLCNPYLRDVRRRIASKIEQLQKDKERTREEAAQTAQKQKRIFELNSFQMRRNLLQAFSERTLVRDDSDREAINNHFSCYLVHVKRGVLGFLCPDKSKAKVDTQDLPEQLYQKMKDLPSLDDITSSELEERETLGLANPKKTKQNGQKSTNTTNTTNTAETGPKRDTKCYDPDDLHRQYNKRIRGNVD